MANTTTVLKTNLMNDFIFLSPSQYIKTAADTDASETNPSADIGCINYHIV